MLRAAATLTATKYSANSQTAAPYLTALGLQAKNVVKFYLLEPGRYDAMPNFTNGDVVILKGASYNSQKGIYYLNNSGFTSTGATIVMDPTGVTTGGLMFYNDLQSTSAGINITGGNIVLSPPTAAPYKGILFWENQNSTVPLQITGQGGMQLSGTFYVAGGPSRSPAAARPTWTSLARSTSAERCRRGATVSSRSTGTRTPWRPSGSCRLWSDPSRDSRCR
jgi:hypothetical protein